MVFGKKEKKNEKDENIFSEISNIPYFDSFVHNNTTWKISEYLITMGYGKEGEGVLDNSKGYYFLSKAKSDTEVKYAVLHLFYDSPDHFKIYVIALENMRSDAQLRMKKEAEGAIDKMNLSSEGTKVFKDRIRDI